MSTILVVFMALQPKAPAWVADVPVGWIGEGADRTPAVVVCKAGSTTERYAYFVPELISREPQQLTQGASTAVAKPLLARSGVGAAKLSGANSLSSSEPLLLLSLKPGVTLWAVSPNGESAPVRTLTDFEAEPVGPVTGDRLKGWPLFYESRFVGFVTYADGQRLKLMPAVSYHGWPE